MTQKKGVCVLGSTGSIGVSTLDVLIRNKSAYDVVALTAHLNVERMLEQCLAVEPQYAVMKDADAAEQLQAGLKAGGSQTQVLEGVEGLNKVASLSEVDIVVAGIVGAAGLSPTLAAAQASKTILLANKEALVMTGDILLSTVEQSGARLLPVDSEHNALFQCMPQTPDGTNLSGVEKILLTASGGPFRGWSHEQLLDVTPAQAVAHPNWSMGQKISVDSASMMNKGLEVIEACFLFDISVDQIQVVVHPESVIHSMVSYTDGSVLAQLGNPDMRTPIAHALAWPERIDAGVKALDLFEIRQLNFEEPDFIAFPCLQLAYDAMQAGGTSPAILNAANEVAVEYFLKGNIRFTQIPEIIAHCLSDITSKPAQSIDDVLQADTLSREMAVEFINQ